MAYTLPHAEAKPPKLSLENVPAQFHKWIPMAEKYGIEDDGYRTELLASLTKVELEECASFAEHFDDVNNSWLANVGNVSSSNPIEYYVFTSLGMAADEASALLSNFT
jgi:hypothetical protein